MTAAKKITFQELCQWDTTIAIGVEVEARWTNCNREYAARAVIAKINRASVRVSLAEPVLDPRESERLCYPEGHSIVAPRPLAGTWSWKNCYLPLETPLMSTQALG